jgi:hypothetical protein
MKVPEDRADSRRMVPHDLLKQLCCRRLVLLQCVFVEVGYLLRQELFDPLFEDVDLSLDRVVVRFGVIAAVLELSKWAYAGLRQRDSQRQAVHWNVELLQGNSTGRYTHEV